MTDFSLSEPFQKYSFEKNDFNRGSGFNRVEPQYNT